MSDGPIYANGKDRSLEWIFANAEFITNMWVYDCPALTALPDLPAVTVLHISVCPALTAIPDLPAVADLLLFDCHALAVLHDLPAVTILTVENCPALTALPDLPAVTTLRVDDCPALTTSAGTDSRGFQFLRARIKGEWRVIAGCRNFSPSEALEHWGPGGSSNRQDCLALVNTLIQQIPSTSVHLTSNAA